VEKKNTEFNKGKFLKKLYRFLKKVYFAVLEKFRDGWRQRGRFCGESEALNKRKKIDFGKKIKTKKK